MSSTTVFVYGTLKQDGYNHFLLKGTEFIGYATTTEKFQMVQVHTFPALLKKEYSTIHGECYRVDDETLKQLDMLELPYGYERYYTWVRLMNTNALERVLCYVSGAQIARKLEGCLSDSVPGFSIVESGKWENVKARKEKEN